MCYSTNGMGASRKKEALCGERNGQAANKMTGSEDRRHTPDVKTARFSLLM